MLDRSGEMPQGDRDRVEIGGASDRQADGSQAGKTGIAVIIRFSGR